MDKNIFLLKTLFIFLFICIIRINDSCIAQKLPDNVTVASFPGGNDSLQSYLKPRLTAILDEERFSQAIVVIVQFKVDTIGQIYEVNISEGLKEKINKKICKVFEEMPRWEPSTMDGKPVKVRMNVPLNIEKTTRIRN